MSSEILINASSGETRVALLESDLLVELYVERNSEQGITGNIYQGRVVRVLPGMQAAFVDIGLERTGFLYVTDVNENFEEFSAMLDRRRKDDEDDYSGEYEERESGVAFPSKPTVVPRIQDLLREGQEVLVQVAKE